MKISIEKGVAVATSETPEEALELVSLVLGKNNATQSTVMPEEKPKRTYIVAKPCEICGEKHKGAKAMGIHKAMKHKVYSKDYEKNKAYREKQALLKGGMLGDINNIK